MLIDAFTQATDQNVFVLFLAIFAMYVVIALFLVLAEEPEESKPVKQKSTPPQKELPPGIREFHRAVMLKQIEKYLQDIFR